MQKILEPANVKSVKKIVYILIWNMHQNVGIVINFCSPKLLIYKCTFFSIKCQKRKGREKKTYDKLNSFVDAKTPKGLLH